MMISRCKRHGKSTAKNTKSSSEILPNRAFRKKTVKVANNIGGNLLHKDRIRKNSKKSVGKRYSRK